MAAPVSESRSHSGQQSRERDASGCNTKDPLPVKAISIADAREALDFLEQHHLEPTVTHYEIALICQVAPDCDLARAVAELVDGGLRLTAGDIDRLTRQYPARADRSDRGRVVEAQANQLGTLTSDAHDLTSTLGNDVGTMIAGSQHWPQETGAFIARLAITERDLADLRAEFAKLHRQIAAGQTPDGGSDDNRDAMTDALSQQGAGLLLSRLRDEDQQYVLILFSIDELVSLNQRFGRLVGDNILNAFASTLRKVFPEHELIRWTGNEFVIVMVNTPLGAARVAAQDAIVAMAARRLKLRGSGDDIGTVTASAGLVAAQGAASDEVLGQARARLKIAAETGGNRFEDGSLV